VINYLNESSQKKQLNSLLGQYNLSHSVNFATRVQNSSSLVMYNIFIDNARLSSTCTSPIANGLSYHDAQYLTVNNIILKVSSTPLKQKTRKINN
jgi:hypothetical protein